MLSTSRCRDSLPATPAFPGCGTSSVAARRLRVVHIGLDVIGGIAGLAEAMLAQAGFALVHVPGLAVNRARQGTVSGENKSDPRDTRTIADQVRTRSDLRPIQPAAELDLEIRLLVSRRGDIVQAQTQRLSRMRDLPVGMFPGLEACLDLKTSATWRSDCEAAGGGDTGGTRPSSSACPA